MGWKQTRPSYHGGGAGSVAGTTAARFSPLVRSPVGRGPPRWSRAAEVISAARLFAFFQAPSRRGIAPMNAARLAALLLVTVTRSGPSWAAGPDVPPARGPWRSWVLHGHAESVDPPRPLPRPHRRTGGRAARRLKGGDGRPRRAGALVARARCASLRVAPRSGSPRLGADPPRGAAPAMGSSLPDSGAGPAGALLGPLCRASGAHRDLSPARTPSLSRLPICSKRCARASSTRAVGVSASLRRSGAAVGRGGA